MIFFRVFEKKSQSMLNQCSVEATGVLNGLNFDLARPFLAHLLTLGDPNPAQRVPGPRKTNLGSK